MSYLHYRASTIGQCLTESLDELIKSAQITPQLAIRVLLQFDKSITDLLSHRVRSRMTLKGHLHTYRYCDDVWTFILENPSIRIADGSPHDLLTCDKLQIVACNANRISPPSRPSDQSTSSSRSRSRSRSDWRERWMDMQWDNDNLLLVRLESGLKIHGLLDSTFPRVRLFLGLPYAHSLPYTHSSQSNSQRGQSSNSQSSNSQSSKVWRAHWFGDACPQVEAYLKQSHDCQSLNIYSPLPQQQNTQNNTQNTTRNTTQNNTRKSLKKVIVWLFGGGFFLGTGSEHKVYDPSFIVNTHPDLLVVTLNYRVGSFGFLVSGDDNDNDRLDGNYGLYDQKAALEWIYSNIQSFGGDPHDITLWGQSAGALSALIQLHSLEFIKKAILQSPPMGLKFRTRSEAAAIGKTFVKKVGCDYHHNHRVLQCLQSKSIPHLLLHTGIFQLSSNINDPVFSNLLMWFPNIDGKIVTKQPMEILADLSKRTDLQIMIGYNKDEMSLLEWVSSRSISLSSSFLSHFFKLPHIPSFKFDSAIVYWGLVQRIFGGRAIEVIKRYPPSSLKSNPHLLMDLLTNALFKCPILKSAQILSSPSSAHVSRTIGRSVYVYNFEFVPDFLYDMGGSCTNEKICHAVELPYVFHAYSNFITFTPREHVLSDTFIHFITSFVTSFPSYVTGRYQAVMKGMESYVDMDGDVRNVPNWLSYPSIMTINDEWKLEGSPMESYGNADCEFWDGFFKGEENRFLLQ